MIAQQSVSKETVHLMDTTAAMDNLHHKGGINNLRMGLVGHPWDSNRAICILDNMVIIHLRILGDTGRPLQGQCTKEVGLL